jgi:hypothetical protein
MLARLFPALFVATLALAICTPAQAQDNSLASGIYTVSFAVPGGGGALVGGKYFNSAKTAIGIDFGYAITIPDKGDNTGGFTIIPSYTYYLTTVDRLLTFVKGAINITKIPGIDFGDAITLDLGGFFGVEFFITPEFSLSGELGVAINFRNKMKDITSQAGTGALFAQFYF